MLIIVITLVLSARNDSALVSIHLDIKGLGTVDDFDVIDDAAFAVLKLGACGPTVRPVSYTHLDVYKRQGLTTDMAGQSG